MNTFESTLLRPRQETRNDVVGVFAMPINATMSNTGDRLAALSNGVGFPLLAVDFYNQDRRKTLGMNARDANVPSGQTFTRMSGNRVDFVLDRLKPVKRDKIIGIGDSLGVPAIEGMALYKPLVFDALNLRDGWNLGREESAVSGIMRYFRYQVRDAANNVINKREFDIPPSEYSQLPLSRPSKVGFLGKVWNVAPAMKGKESMENALKLVGKVPMHIVLFDNGLSGTREQARQFKDELDHTMKESALKAPLKVHLVPGWHTDLLDPARGARDIKETLTLIKR